ncbi:hypothetical protein E2C01_070978 [Portunus trituberculatus]|uniref:Uncharacterized protein n=1 Tax=Portunus trituberculatus TaxID=210409 RepID=A0A5B7HYS7_PORTR|nr:hypothetical protein [Portunus trituberculatus]
MKVNESVEAVVSSPSVLSLVSRSDGALLILTPVHQGRTRGAMSWKVLGQRHSRTWLDVSHYLY